MICGFRLDYGIATAIIGAIVSSLESSRKSGFSIERALFLTVMHRLFVSGSDRGCERWRRDYVIPGPDSLQRRQLYQAMAFLGEELTDQEDRTPFALRCTKDLIEERMFNRRRDLFSDLDLVFLDTTSIHFEGQGGDTIGRKGHSKSHRPDLNQMVVGALLDERGRPICCEMWPGNTADVATTLPVVTRLKNRFGACRFCIVADRGMINKDTIQGLEEAELSYILGVRMRQAKEVKNDVLLDQGEYVEVYPEGAASKDPSPLKVKEVTVDDTRYIVCKLVRCWRGSSPTRWRPKPHAVSSDVSRNRNFRS